MRVPGERWARDHPTVVDSLLAIVLLTPSALASAATQDLVFVLDVYLLACLALRRRAPVVGFGLLCLGLLAQAVLRDTPQWGDVAFLFGLYAIAAYGPQWARWAGLGTGFLGAAVATATWNDPASAANAVFSFISLSALVLFAWTWGDRMRTRRAYVAGLEVRAVQLEREAEHQAQIAAAAERARIAREMHDVVAHSLSVIVVQADGALFAERKRPGVAVETLSTISRTGRESLAEMRRLIGLLRNGETASPGELAPMPSAADLSSLVEQVSASGLRVGLDVDGDVGLLGSGAGLTVYRVVQEALTNTLKHGGPQVSAQVSVAVGADAATVRVDDDGRGAAVANDGDGHGLEGMRERIAVHDGTIVAGPRPGGGFRVDARIPYSTAEGDA